MQAMHNNTTITPDQENFLLIINPLQDDLL
jgi:hypothetical protein